MKIKNPFPYSSDNKRYHTWNYYLKNRFHNKVFKVPLNANFSCPNRDGTCGVGGCTFCTSLGSGDCAGDIHDDIQLQFEKGLAVMQKKWPEGKAFAYFQAYTNTYAPLPVLKQYFDPFMERDDVYGIAIATRADCLEDEKIEYLNSLAEKKEIWVELGLQSVYNQTAQTINRGHTYEIFEDCVRRLSHTNIKICVHLINNLPNETKEMMVHSAKVIAQLPIHAVKIHMLHIMKHTVIAKQYEKEPFPLMERDEYVDTVIQQLEVLPPHIIIQRLTGDGVKEELIAPLWTLKKVVVLNEIDKEMARRNTWQGKALDL